MSFAECIEKSTAVLMEGALGERLKREYGIKFDDNVDMAGLVYSQEGRRALKNLWNGYIDIARRYNLPFLATTPTRRANRKRVYMGRYSETIVKENVDFLRGIQDKSGIEMYVGGLMGCMGDAYTGEGCLSQDEAFRFHRWAAELFRQAGADFIYAAILPTVPEAAGMAQALSHTGLPYIISFTIQRDGRLIDGTPISEAIEYIDGICEPAPVCYMTNCVHPDIVYEALSKDFNRTETVKKRFLGIQGNTSPLSYSELDGSKDLKSAEPADFAADIIRLKEISDIKIFGGCCGTDSRHMEETARRL